MTRSQPTYSHREYLAPCGRGIADTGPAGLVLPTMAAAGDPSAGSAIESVWFVCENLGMFATVFQSDSDTTCGGHSHRRWLCRALRC